MFGGCQCLKMTEDSVSEEMRTEMSFPSNAVAKGSADGEATLKTNCSWENFFAVPDDRWNREENKDPFSKIEGNVWQSESCESAFEQCHYIAGVGISSNKGVAIERSFEDLSPKNINRPCTHLPTELLSSFPESKTKAIQIHKRMKKAPFTESTTRRSINSSTPFSNQELRAQEECDKPPIPTAGNAEENDPVAILMKTLIVPKHMGKIDVSQTSVAGAVVNLRDHEEDGPGRGCESFPAAVKLYAGYQTSPSESEEDVETEICESPFFDEQAHMMNKRHRLEGVHAVGLSDFKCSGSKGGIQSRIVEDSTSLIFLSTAPEAVQNDTNDGKEQKKYFDASTVGEGQSWSSTATTNENRGSMAQNAKDEEPFIDSLRNTSLIEGIAMAVSNEDVIRNVNFEWLREQLFGEWTDSTVFINYLTILGGTDFKAKYPNSKPGAHELSKAQDIIIDLTYRTKVPSLTKWMSNTTPVSACYRVYDQKKGTIIVEEIFETLGVPAGKCFRGVQEYVFTAIGPDKRDIQVTKRGTLDWKSPHMLRRLVNQHYADECRSHAAVLAENVPRLAMRDENYVLERIKAYA